MGHIARTNLAVVAVLLAGCASLDAPSSGRAEINASLTTPCQDLPLLTDGTGKVVFQWVIEVAQMYRDCADKHRAMVEAVR